MRSNLGGQGLKHIIQDQVALAKTMREFSIIKMLRRKRKNKKQYILWGGMEKTAIEVNPTYTKESEVK